jgi:hypothetical protein
MGRKTFIQTRLYSRAVSFPKSYVELEKADWCGIDGKSIKGTVKNANNSQQNFIH